MVLGSLRHNVIKTGVRMISLSYSRISLADLAGKLHLESAEDAEYIVAKVGQIGHRAARAGGHSCNEGAKTGR